MNEKLLTVGRIPGSHTPFHRGLLAKFTDKLITSATAPPPSVTVHLEPTGHQRFAIPQSRSLAKLSLFGAKSSFQSVTKRMPGCDARL